MRQELQYKNSPLVWTVFVLFFLFYCCGFLLDDNLNEGYLFRQTEISASLYYLQNLAPQLFLLMILMTWLSVYFCENNLPVLHRFIYACSKNKISDIWLYSPIWLISYGLLLISGLWLYLNENLNPNLDQLSSLWFGRTSIYSPDFIIMCLLFVLRDIFIAIYFNLKNSFNRPDSSALIFLILLYVLMPAIINLTLGKQWLFIFLPIFFEQHWYHLVPVVLQVMVMAFIVITLYRKKSP